MKTLPTALADHYALGTTRLSQAILITRTDSASFGFTSAQAAATINGVRYEASGLQLSEVVTSLDMSVGNLELSTIDDGSVFNRADIFGGLWDNAAYSIFEYNRADPDGGKNVLVAGTFGQVTLSRNMVVVELRDLMQYLQQPVGEVSTKNCRNRLGDARCRVDLAPFTVAGSITSVTSTQVFADNTQTQPDDWFGDGVITFTSGANAGFSQQVKSFSGGVFTLVLPLFSPLVVGDTFTAVPGCRKRHDRTLANPGGASDCLDKFNNVLNFRGEPHRPGVDQITSAPEVSA